MTAIHAMALNQRLEEERKRLSIAMQRLYVALLAQDEARGGQLGASDFFGLMDGAVACGLVTPSARDSIRGLAFEWLHEEEPEEDDQPAAEEWDVPWFPEPGEHPSAEEGDACDEAELAGIAEAADQIALLAKRIEGQVPIGQVAGLARPTVLDSWTPLPQALEALDASDGFVAVRDVSGYCVLLSQHDVGAWLVQAGSPLPEPFSMSVSDVLGHGREQWSAVDATVPTEQVERLASDWSARIAAVLVFANEDYSGDPVGLVTARTFQEWQRAGERRRRSVAAQFEGQVAELAPVQTAITRRTEGIESLLADLHLDRLFIEDDDELDRVALAAIAGSTRGVTSSELLDILQGTRSKNIVDRGLAALPMFGCAHAMSSARLDRRLARLVSLGLVRRSRAGSLVLSGTALSALASDDPATALAALLNDAEADAEKGGEA